MDKKITKFGDTEIEKHKFHQHKSPVSINNIDINKIVVSNKSLFRKKGFKHFIGYSDSKEIRPLCIFLPKMSAYRRDFDETKYMSFLIKDEELLEKYNEILEKCSNNTKKGFDKEPIYNEKYLKTKIKSYEGKINTNFHNDKIPKESSQCIYLSISNFD